MDAVYAFAQALHSAWLDLCRGKKRVCKELKELDGGHFYKHYLLKVNFTGKKISFDFFISAIESSWQAHSGFLNCTNRLSEIFIHH